MVFLPDTAAFFLLLNFLSCHTTIYIIVILRKDMWRRTGVFLPFVNKVM
jgi:hypothetical protein